MQARWVDAAGPAPEAAPRPSDQAVPADDLASGLARARDEQRWNAAAGQDESQVAASASGAVLVGLALRRLGLASAIGHLARVLAVMRALVRQTQRGAKVAAALAATGAVLWAVRRATRKRKRVPPRRVAVVGSGIAGCGAAWALQRAGVDVVLYEKKPKVGGNAKAMTWDVGGRKVETGLAVFAWPRQLFHNYNALIDELGLPTEDHDTKFYVTERKPSGETECVFAHDKADWEPAPWLREDLRKWDSLCAAVKRVNAFLQPSALPSLYRTSFLNPLNTIPLRTLCRLWGISGKFWDLVFVPVHTSTFLEVEMGSVPASMAELLDDIVPFSRTPNLRTWKTHAYDAALSMLRGLDKASVRTSCAVETVRFQPRHQDGDFQVTVVDEGAQEERFDAVVFACSAQAMNRILHGKGQALPGQEIVPNDANGLNNAPGVFPFAARMLNWLETSLLSRTLYTTDRDKSFERGIVHSSAEAVLPAQHRAQVLDGYCNYIEVDSRAPSRLENTFVISSWAPTAQHPAVRGKLPMLVTYNAEDKLEGVPTEWVSTSREAHPCLTFFQMASSVLLWPFLQGARARQAYFCGSAVLPANGHDLSFLSGLVVAHELGVPYPFAHKPEAYADFVRLRAMMLGPLA